MPSAFVSNRIAPTLTSASIGFARRAVELSKASSWDRVGELTSRHQIENLRVMEQTIGEII